jgi:S-adenosylmethionine-diacylglycerol 3-amino-3-carboxypropyl transferase
MLLLKNNKSTKIRYSQCWEDANVVLEALRINNQDVVLSIGSGGCNSFSIISKNPEKIFIIDNNSAQIELVKLKISAIKHLNYEQVLEFFGITKSQKRIEYLDSVSEKLDEKSQYFWSNKLKIIKKGIIHSGKFEKYLSFFRKYLLILIQPNSYKDFLLNCNDKIVQKNFYDKQWNNFRWKFFFKIFFSKKIMHKHGRSKEMFQYQQNNNSGQVFLSRIEQGIKEGNIYENEYLEYILKGNFICYLPHYLKKTEFEKIKEFTNFEIIENNMFDFLKKMPDNSISKFNLSDIFEALSEEFSNNLFNEIYRTAKNNSLIIFWNNLVYRNIPKNLKQYFILDQSLIEKMNQKDKIFFYEKFYIYQIIKN